MPSLYDANDESARHFAKAMHLLLEQTWPVPAAMEQTRAAASADDPRVVVDAMVAAMDLTHEHHPSARFWWKDDQLLWRGVCARIAADAGFSAVDEMIGISDDSPGVPWNRQAAGYHRHDREVMADRQPRLNIVERQDRPDGSVVWLLTSKVPVLDGDRVLGTVGGFSAIDAAEAGRRKRGG